MHCHYCDERTFREIDESYDRVLGQIVKMADQADKWLIRPKGDESCLTRPRKERSRQVTLTWILRHTDNSDTPPRHPFLLERLIEASARNPFFVLILTAFGIAGAIWALTRTPLDAIPDLSDVQVIVYTEWKAVRRSG